MRTFSKVLLLALALLVFVCITLYQVMNARTFQLSGVLVSKVETSEKVVALTIDDGPDEHVDDILRILAEEDVPATFFLVGNAMARHPEAARKLVMAGHELGNHSYSHQRMIFEDTSFVADEITNTDTLIRAAGHSGEILFRPPFGKKLWTLPRYLARHERRTLMWSLEPDSLSTLAHDHEKMRESVEKNVHPGAIILLHLWGSERAASRQALRGIIQDLKPQGYRFLKASELLALAP